MGQAYALPARHGTPSAVRPGMRRGRATAGRREPPQHPPPGSLACGAGRATSAAHKSGAARFRAA